MCLDWLEIDWIFPAAQLLSTASFVMLVTSRCKKMLLSIKCTAGQGSVAPLCCVVWMLVAEKTWLEACRA